MQDLWVRVERQGSQQEGRVVLPSHVISLTVRSHGTRTGPEPVTLAGSGLLRVFELVAVQWWVGPQPDCGFLRKEGSWWDGEED